MSDEVSITKLQQENQQLRHAVFALVNERNRMSTKVVGIQNLGEQIQEKNEQIQTLNAKVERLQDALARAENRIAQLNIQVGNGPQTASQGAIVTPGVSKKVLEALTKENTKLRLALDHLADKIPNGTDLAVENKELHELIVAQRNELVQKTIELKEIKAALDATQEQDMVTLQDQIMRLSVQENKLQRQLSAKQTFCETLVTENERLKDVVQTARNERITEVSSLRKQLGRVMQSSPEIKRIMDQVACDDKDGSQNNEVMKELDELRVQLNERQAALQKVEEDHYRLQEVCKTLETQLNEKEDQVENYKRTMSEYKSQVDVLTQEHEDLRAGQEEVPKLQRELEEKMQQYQLLWDEHKLMQEALKSYEHDWKMEKQEKDNIKAEHSRVSTEAKEVTRQYDVLKREFESLKHMFSSPQQPRSPPPTAALSPAQQFKRQQFYEQSCAREMKQPWQLGYQNTMRSPFGAAVVADCPGDEHTDCAASSPQQQQKQQPPKPAPRRLPSSPQSSEIQCPICQLVLPCDLIETHMRDCCGD